MACLFLKTEQWSQAINWYFIVFVCDSFLVWRVWPKMPTQSVHKEERKFIWLCLSRIRPIEYQHSTLFCVFAVFYRMKINKKCVEFLKIYFAFCLDISSDAKQNLYAMDWLTRRRTKNDYADIFDHSIRMQIFIPIIFLKIPLCMIENADTTHSCRPENEV